MDPYTMKCRYTFVDHCYVEVVYKLWLTAQDKYWEKWKVYVCYFHLWNQSNFGTPSTFASASMHPDRSVIRVSRMFVK